MKRLLKFLLTGIIVLLISFWLTKAYLVHSVKQRVTESSINVLVKRINSAPALPQDFKDLYAKVYPGIFENDLTISTLKNLLGKTQKQCPSRQLANQFWFLFTNSKTFIGRKLDYLGFTWTIEEQVTQEKCFEYVVSIMDFLHNTKGPEQAARFYYHKDLNQLTTEEQLGMILKLDNPALYDNLRRPAYCDAAVKELMDKLQDL